MKRFPLSVLPLVAAASLASAQSFEVAKIPADSAKGFQWPYYLCVPATVKQPAVLLVQPNASLGPSDDFSTHDVTAYGQAFHTQTDQGFAALGSPSLVPVFPRPRDLYTQSLDRDTLLTQRSGYQRLDLQLIAMVEDARARLAARGIVADQKFWMRGFSAAGAFASRFSLLHPELVKAVSVGGAGLGPALPVASWKGKTLYYPLGVADLETLTGKKFDLGSFRQIAFQFYVGDADTASTGAAFQPGTNPEDALLAELFGSPNIPLSFMRFEEVYTSVTTLSQFLVFPGVGHEEQPSSFDIAFFERNRGTPAAPPRSRCCTQRKLPTWSAGLRVAQPSRW